MDDLVYGEERLKGVRHIQRTMIFGEGGVCDLIIHLELLARPPMGRRRSDYVKIADMAHPILSVQI